MSTNLTPMEEKILTLLAECLFESIVKEVEEEQALKQTQ